MILFNYFDEEITQIKNEFQQKIKHPYILKFVDEPELDDDRLFLLYSILDQKKLAKENISDYIITTLLVQAALDTHETVTLANITSDKVKKERQLTVLAGDYYSSLYYFLLAKIKDITMIRLLANSIQEINESKMSFYKTSKHNLAQTIKDIKVIESSLIQKIADHFKLPVWKAVASEFFFLKRLLSEREKMVNGQQAPLMESILNERGLKGDLSRRLEVCDDLIIDTQSQLHMLCRTPSPLSSFIIERMNQLLIETDILKEKVAEEG